MFLMPVTLLSFVFSTAIFCLGVIAWMSKDYVDRVHIEPVLKGLMLYHLLAGVSFFYGVKQYGHGFNRSNNDGIRDSL